jgi:hypothetical protein
MLEQGSAHHAAAGGAVFLHAAATDDVDGTTVVGGPFKLCRTLAVCVDEV